MNLGYPLLLVPSLDPGGDNPLLFQCRHVFELVMMRAHEDLNPLMLLIVDWRDSVCIAGWALLSFMDYFNLSNTCSLKVGDLVFLSFIMHAFFYSYYVLTLAQRSERRS